MVDTFTAALYLMGSMTLVVVAFWLYYFIKETRAHVRKEIFALEVDLRLWQYRKRYAPQGFRQDSYGREASLRWDGKKYELN